MYIVVYIHALFLFWLVIVVVLNFEAKSCFGFKVDYVDVFGCCFGCLCPPCFHCVILGYAFNQGVMLCCVTVVFVFSSSLLFGFCCLGRSCPVERLKPLHSGAHV